MNKENKYDLVKAGIWYTLSNITVKGIPFFSLPLFVRLLSTEDFGLYNTYLSYENLLCILFGLGISGTIKTAKFDFTKDFENYISSIYFLLSALFVIILPLIITTFTLFFDDRWMTSFLLFILLSHSFSAAIFNINGVKLIIQGEYKKNLFYSLANTICNVGVSLLLCLYFWTTERYVGRIIGTALSFIFLMIISCFFQYKNAMPRPNQEYWLYALKMGIPLIPHMLSVTLLSSCDKIMIQTIIGNSEAGIYSLSVNLALILSVLLTSLENAWAPWFYSSLAKREYVAIREKNNQLISFFMYLTCSCILIGPELITIFSTSEYSESIYSFIPLAISIFLNFVYLIPINLEYFHKKTHYISLATVICAVMNLMLNYFFITSMGYIYAAHATCISKLLLLLFHCVVAKHIEPQKLFSKNVVMFSLLVIIISAIVTKVVLENLLIRWGMIVLLSIIMAIKIVKGGGKMNKKSIK